jgi:amino acid adenylation domain-containing protein
VIERLHDWITAQGTARPEATAVVMDDARLSYAALESASNRLAWALRTVGCERGDRVALLLPKSPAAIVAILATLKADAIYVPLDTASPAPRLAHMLKACEPRCLLAAEAVAPTVDTLLAQGALSRRVPIGWTGKAGRFALGDGGVHLHEPPPSFAGRHDVAYLLFTSGSTGTPKGVPITHGAVVRFVEWARTYFGLAPDDRVSGHPPLHFDLSVFDIFGTLAAGGVLYPVPPDTSLVPRRLLDFIRGHALTQWFSVPAVLTYLAKFDALDHGDLPALRRVLWCGEVLPTSVLRYWMTRLPHVTFTNLYGPTETTIASSYHTVPACPADDRAEIPIGRACDGEALLVLDEALRPVGPDVPGDLYIAGVGLSPGYWRDPERSAQAFLTAPDRPGDRLYRTGDRARLGADGLLYFLGRADTQIKSRGYRIELGEIEAAINTLTTVKESAVVAVVTDGFEGASICCAYAPVPGARLTPLHLRAELSRLLPAYMVPARWRAFDRLPKNANGKIDRPRLKEAFERDAA